MEIRSTGAACAGAVAGSAGIDSRYFSSIGLACRIRSTIFMIMMYYDNLFRMVSIMGEANL
ncbi:MAG: hypothetical protein JWR03_2565 [Cohnella sp.]|nr:hypothetical protein [Cohnella sp.]